MDCDSIRAAVSAGLDGEDAGVPAGVLRAHLDECAGCRDWRERQHALTRRARLSGFALDHDLTARILGALPATSPRPARMPVARRVALAVVGVAQLAITVPLLILGHDRAAGVHAAHELGSFDLALAFAFVVGAVRPRLSAGLAWPCCVAALGLAGTAIIDMMGGQTFGADEAQHLVAVVGALLLFWQSRDPSFRTVPADSTAPPAPHGYAGVTAWEAEDGLAGARLTGDRLTGDRLSGDRLTGDRLSGERGRSVARKADVA